MPLLNTQSKRVRWYWFQGIYLHSKSQCKHICHLALAEFFFYLSHLDSIIFKRYILCKWQYVNLNSFPCSTFLLRPSKCHIKYKPPCVKYSINSIISFEVYKSLTVNLNSKRHEQMGKEKSYNRVLLFVQQKWITFLPKLGYNHSI